MAVPTTYDLDALAQYLHGQLGELADLLGWDPDQGHYDEAVNDALLALGYTSPAEATTAIAIQQLRQVANVMLYRSVKRAVITEINVSADGASLGREKIYQHVAEVLQELEAEAMPLLGSYAVESSRITRADDPYSWDPDEDEWE